MCDNSRFPKERSEGKDEVAKLLQTVQLLKEKHKAKYITNFLCGKKSNEITTYKHDLLPEFGTGNYNDHDEKFWNAAIRQSIVGGFLYKEIEQYGILHLTDKGREFMQTPHSFELIKEHDYTGVSGDDDVIVNTKSNGSAVDSTLFAMLKDLRKTIAKSKSLPPFVIFQDPSLEDMALQYPITMEELVNIQGVGAGKAKKFGKDFIEMIAAYVEENNIERPQDLVVKSVVKKSVNKVHIIMNIDRKLPLEDIAKSKGLELDTVISEIEAIVSSGTKVNIGYYVDDIIDEEQQEEIFEYFNEAESDSIEEALEEFDGEYSEEEMR